MLGCRPREPRRTIPDLKHTGAEGADSAPARDRHGCAIAAAPAFAPWRDRPGARARATPKAFRFERGTCIQGAGADSNVVIENPSVSRSHVELGLVPEGITVRDLGSRNGSISVNACKR